MACAISTSHWQPTQTTQTTVKLTLIKTTVHFLRAREDVNYAEEAVERLHIISHFFIYRFTHKSRGRGHISNIARDSSPGGLPRLAVDCHGLPRLRTNVPEVKAYVFLNTLMYVVYSFARNSLPLTRDQSFSNM